MTTHQYPIKEALRSFVPYTFAGAVLLLAFLILLPLLTPILSAVILAYLYFPIYIKFCSIFKKKTAALLSILSIILTLLAPVFVLLLLVFMNYALIVSFLTSLTPLISSFISSFLRSSIGNTMFSAINVDSVLNTMTGTLLKVVQRLVVDIPQLLIGSFITLFMIYYLLKNGTEITLFIKSLLPLKKEQTEIMVGRFNALGRGMVLSQFIIAIVQAVLIAIACLIIHSPHALLITLLTFFFAIIPFLGAFIVWGSLSFILAVFAAKGLVPGWHPIFMLLYGALFVSTIDNFLRPKILSDSTQINPAIVLVGFIGGFILFGLPGIFIGPMILTLTELAIELIRNG